MVTPKAAKAALRADTRRVRCRASPSTTSCKEREEGTRDIGILGILEYWGYWKCLFSPAPESGGSCSSQHLFSFLLLLIGCCFYFFHFDHR